MSDQRGSNNGNWRGGVSKDNMRYKRQQKERYPERVYARELARRARRSGRLVPQPCEQCGALEVSGHHMDYSKPLDVTWLCDSCHRTEHVENPMPSRRLQPGEFMWRGRIRGNRSGLSGFRRKNGDSGSRK